MQITIYDEMKLFSKNVFFLTYFTELHMKEINSHTWTEMCPTNSDGKGLVRN